MKKLWKNIYNLVVESGIKGSLKKINDNKIKYCILFIYWLLIILILILIFTSNESYIKILLGILVIVLLIIFKRTHSFLFKEIDKIDKDKKNLISLYYLCVSLIMTNISIFVFLWSWFIFINNDHLGIHKLLKYIYNYIHINEYSFIIRFYIIILCILILVMLIRPKIFNELSKQKVNNFTKDQMLFIEEKINYFLKNLPNLFFTYLYYENFLIIIMLLSTVLLNYLKWKILIVFTLILLVIMFIGIIFDLYVNIKIRIMIFNYVYKPNPGPDWQSYFEFLKKLRENTVLFKNYDLNTLSKLNKRMAAVFIFINASYFTGYYIWLQMHGDNYQYPPQRQLRKKVKWIYDKMDWIKDLPEDHPFKKDPYKKKD
jgi:hypothetical protein